MEALDKSRKPSQIVDNSKLVRNVSSMQEARMDTDVGEKQWRRSGVDGAIGLDGTEMPVLNPSSQNTQINESAHPDLISIEASPTDSCTTVGQTVCSPFELRGRLVCDAYRHVPQKTSSDHVPVYAWLRLQVNTEVYPGLVFPDASASFPSVSAATVLT